MTDVKKWTRLAGVAVLCAFLGAIAAAAQPQVNAQAAAMAEFGKRVQAYVTLEKHLAGGLPPLKSTADEKEIAVAERALADAIRAARTSAQPGDLFTPDVAPIFQQAIRDHYRQQTVHARKEMLEDSPLFRPVVNQVYPATLPKGTFPPALFRSLPKLPQEVQYRIVSTYLVLLDLKTHVIIDFLPEVLPAAAKTQEGKL